MTSDRFELALEAASFTMYDRHPDDLPTEELRRLKTTVAAVVWETTKDDLRTVGDFPR